MLSCILMLLPNAIQFSFGEANQIITMTATTTMIIIVTITVAIAMGRAAKFGLLKLIESNSGSKSVRPFA